MWIPVTGDRKQVFFFFFLGFSPSLLDLAPCVLAALMTPDAARE